MGKSKKSARKAKIENHEHHENHPINDDDVAANAEVSVGQNTNADAAPVVTARKSTKDAAPKVPREERNGVKRPRPGKCLEVWEYLDQHGDMKANDLKPVAVEKGWNSNNASIELYQWRKFNGIARTAPK
ncbi:MAG: hypothetical protein KBA31_13080 [Alphaproteobacteria bacterium]|nr:hypothetical protein [Alphaproteobacteria bacterium]